jgi:predicted metal-dependent enzyme (double-stranded beta helix superfamily)
MFDVDKFVEDCKAAVSEGQKAMREVVAEAVSDPAAVIKGVGAPEHAGIVPLYRAKDLTIINFAWAPYMCLMPHNHQMYAIIGIFDGREDNIFWRRTENSIEAAGAETLGPSDVATLGHQIIHSVTNPIGKLTAALHVYGGDFFEPEVPRVEWDHETLQERPWEIERARKVFSDAEARFSANPS